MKTMPPIDQILSPAENVRFYISMKRVNKEQEMDKKTLVKIGKLIDKAKNKGETSIIIKSKCATVGVVKELKDKGYKGYYMGNGSFCIDWSWF